MATTYKVLGQSSPSATTLTSLYTVPSSTSTVVSTITVANLASSSATFRIAVRPAAESIANKHYIAYDVTVAALDTLTLTLGLTLATTDVISIYASTATMAFAAYGSEIS
jgi:glucose-6-phosphate dehydrogenase assembly protein OpcA